MGKKYRGSEKVILRQTRDSWDHFQKERKRLVSCNRSLGQVQERISEGGQEVGRGMWPRNEGWGGGGRVGPLLESFECRKDSLLRGARLDAGLTSMLII